MGQVWAARHHGTRGFQKLVAVKTILPSHEDAGQLEAMLFEEASLASLIRHPNVVETLDLGEREDGTLYLAMEWVAGEPLDYILRAAEPGGVPMGLVAHFIGQALKGLHAVHETRDSNGHPLGIVHRDMSLQNLLVTYGGVVKLIDFGIAKATQKMSAPTDDGTIKGKFGYMSPEQLRGDPLDARADLFGLGVVLYRATTGAHPFKADNPAATIHSILTEQPRRPTDFVAGYPKAIEEVAMRALAKDPDARFSSAQEMRFALERALPAAWRTNAEKDSEAFLRTLFKERIAERERALKAALAAADAGNREAPHEVRPPFPRSLSTMRAVSLETGEIDMVSGAPLALDGPEDGPGGAGVEAPRVPRAVRRRTAGALAALSLVALVAGGLGLAGRSATRGSLPASTAGVAGAAHADAAPLPPASEASSAPARASSPSTAADAPRASGSSDPSPLPNASRTTAPRKREHAEATGVTSAAPSASTAHVVVPTQVPPAPTDPLSRRK